VTSTTGGVDGYQAISIPFTGNNWGGLEHNGGPALMDGQVVRNAQQSTVVSRLQNGSSDSFVLLLVCCSCLWLLDVSDTSAAINRA
jgi:hypothetical protein